MVTWIWVSIGSGNGLLPDGTKPLPEPLLTLCQSGPVVSPEGCSTGNNPGSSHWDVFQNRTIKFASTPPRGQRVQCVTLLDASNRCALNFTANPLIWAASIPKTLNVSGVVLQLSLPNPLKPGVRSRMQIYLEQCRQGRLQLHLSDQQLYCLLRCSLY